MKENVESDNPCKDRRTAISVSILRGAKESENLDVIWIEGKDQLADIFTKESVNANPLRSVIQRGQIL